MSTHPGVGLYNKFNVIRRTDGSSAPGRKHDGCRYFVLDLTHDPFARSAIIAYADACEGKCPELAADLYATASAMSHGERLPSFPDLSEAIRKSLSGPHIRVLETEGAGQTLGEVYNRAKLVAGWPRGSDFREVSDVEQARLLRGLGLRP